MTATAIPGPALTHIRLTEPALAFDPADAAQQHLNPLAGLAAFGPHSADAWTAAGRQVRVAILAPHDVIGPVRGLLNSLREAAEPLERADYLPSYPGFKAAFRAPLIPAAAAAQQPLPDDLDAQMAASAEPHLALARALTAGLGRLAAVRSLFDVVVFYLPSRWELHFTVGEFDLHDHVKAAAAQLGLPTQIVTDQALGYHCRASVGWRLAMALYAKAGGTPYKLAAGGMLDPSAAYVGLAYGIRGPGRPGHGFVVCCSQLFDGQGGGLEFVAYDLTGDVDPANPLLSCAQMRTVLSRSLGIYADRHAGRRPRPARRPQSIPVHRGGNPRRRRGMGPRRGPHLRQSHQARLARDPGHRRRRRRQPPVWVRRRPRHPGPARRAQRAAVGRRQRQHRDADRPPLPARREGHPPAAPAHPPRRPRPAGRTRRAGPGSEQNGLEYRRPVSQPARHCQLRADAGQRRQARETAAHPVRLPAVHVIGRRQALRLGGALKSFRQSARSTAVTLPRMVASSAGIGG